MTTLDSDRPDPDHLLARVQADEAQSRRGRLKIFFGYAAGVGKTFAMLQAAHREKAEGHEVVVGYVEPHGRVDTEALLEGLETIPTRPVTYRGMTLREFDLDAALARKPEILLVDELAHTNAEGSRHPKRYQDVDELLNAGINVYTTLNVQHLESLNDVIAQITGVIVRETLPDKVFERADDIELIDLTPSELMERLREGKVYLSAQAERALQSFFQKANLTALRELSLRRSADRINVDVQTERQGVPGRPSWPTRERLVVCVGPSPTSAKVIRSAKRMAASLHADWFAVSVKPPTASDLSPEQEERLAAHLRLAEQLGGESVVLCGDAADEILRFAQERNATKIIVGKPVENRPWRWRWRSSLVDALLHKSGEIDVYVIRGTGDTVVSAATQRRPTRPPWTGYLAACLATAMATLIGVGLYALGLSETNIAMVFLVAVIGVAALFGRAPGVLASFLCVLAFDFFFVHPVLTFVVADIEYLVTFGVLLSVSLLISQLTARLREEVEVARLREHRTDSLYRLGRQLSGVTGTEFILQLAGQQLQETFGGRWAVLLPTATRQLETRWTSRESPAPDPALLGVCQWVFEHGEAAGPGTQTLPHAAALVVPLPGAQSTFGVLLTWDRGRELWERPDVRRQLETMAGLIALALERDRLTLTARKAELDAETERLRNTLLSSVSHDLRTPLAVIAGASSTLLSRTAGDTEQSERELLQTITHEAGRLSRLIESLLQITRIESGGLDVHREWHVVEELIGSALRRVQDHFPGRLIQVSIDPHLPLVSLDALLIEQVCVNLLENACQYTPADRPISVEARGDGSRLTVTVADQGPGLAEGEPRRVFEKFYRGTAVPHGDRRGAGLGLAICKAIIEAHGGKIHAGNNQPTGARFWFELPLFDPPVV